MKNFDMLRHAAHNT